MILQQQQFETYAPAQYTETRTIAPYSGDMVDLIRDEHAEGVIPVCQDNARVYPLIVVELGPQTLALLGRFAAAMEALLGESRRVADHVVPTVGEVVGTPYLAKHLGCSVVWAAEMARTGQIPKYCVVPGTGNGKPWKFFRERIEEWLIKR
jgi:hypothetical protein